MTKKKFTFTMQLNITINQKLIITKKPKGEDGHKVFSIRIKDETIERLDDIAKQTNRSRNDLINMLLDFAMDYCEVHDGE